MRTLEAGEALPAEPVAEEKGSRRFFIAVLAVVGLVWLLPLTSSLWIDETSTRWVVEPGFASMLRRVVVFQWQSPLWYSVEWVWVRLAGTSELALRLPSLLCGVAAVWLFHRLATRLLGRVDSLGATVVFASLTGVSFAAGDARPYSAAMAALIGATLALVRWAEDRRARDAVVYVALTVAAVYLHYIFALVLIAHAIYVFDRVRRGFVSPRPAVLAGSSIAGLLAPAVYHLAWLSDQPSSALVPPGDNGLLALARSFAPVGVLEGLGVVLIAAAALGHWSLPAEARRSGVRLLVGSWVFAVPVGLFILSRVSTPRFFTGRYMLSATPGIALLLGWVISRITHRSLARIAIGAVVLAGIFGSGGRYHTFEHWREAAETSRLEASRGSELVLLHAAFIEAKRVDWLEDTGERSGAITAPALAYPMGSPVVPMPFFIDAPADGYLERLTATRLRSLDRFVLVTQMPWVPLREWLDERLGGEGFSSRLVGQAGVIRIYRFERAAPA